MMKLEPGQKAPSFSLYDSDKNKINLSDLEGRNVLLLFFPLAFTSVCTADYVVLGITLPVIISSTQKFLALV
jgi:peroxiredoxin